MNYKRFYQEKYDIRKVVVQKVIPSRRYSILKNILKIAVTKAKTKSPKRSNKLEIVILFSQQADSNTKIRESSTRGSPTGDHP